ncbi:MAG: cation transporter [Chitinispirillaceae bacterium]|nr:cation transporter [Chitinispirillaceae bacterium]
MDNTKLWHAASWAAIITILYNIVEGVVSVIFGYSDETLSLFGFGLDSFVEVISGIGVLHMIISVRKNKDTRDLFERIALRITGISFYILTAGLIVTSVMSIINKSHPSTTFRGIIISLISIFTMIFLLKFKMNIGKKLNSNSIIADANCTKTCVYLSIILLISSLLYEVFKIGFIDSIGALGIAWYAFNEGREAFEKARGKSCSCCK